MNMTFLLFLGAGSSNPFGIPTMKEMTRNFEYVLTGKHQKLYSKIKQAVTNYKYDIDIETMFSIIDGIASKKSLNDFGPYVHYLQPNFSDYIPSDDDQKIANELKEKLENYIKKICVSDFSPKQFRKMFERTFFPIFTLLKFFSIVSFRYV